jgi:16S rRNA processing protein RimM
MPVWKLENGVHVGKILKAHSYLGHARVAFFMPGLEDYLEPGDSIFIVWNEKPVPYQIEEIKWGDDKVAIIKLVDVSIEIQAIELKDRDIVLPTDAFPEELLDEMEGATIEGYKVIDNVTKKEIGEVTAIVENGPQSLLEIKSTDGKEFLIPVHEDIILKIDRKKRKITVNLPEGLLDL